jgi:hypothetical protein
VSAQNHVSKQDLNLELVQEKTCSLSEVYM